MTSNNWLAMFVAGVVGIAVYLIATRPNPEDDGWSDITDRDWWDL